ncbi:hypothetical protein DV711_09410 [Motiliproteus coralliicola]|uniref:Uncharacterized protein n=1 Tax=Motiliproteus coralliicola TaxID=2283196 RepID=A0A369WMQ8_9GAMM|nr:hypothetical protein [Motiliproteus coralliicola]RDE22781.1 hypothetical protein DV711_09410 [Motiliproteus coralliicola]
MRALPLSATTATLAALLLTLSSGPAQAHFFAEAHDCEAPEKPLEFITELDQQEFQQLVDAYRGCLQSFVDKQNAAMEKHRSAGQRAADSWDRYQQQVLGINPADETAEPSTTQ